MTAAPGAALRRLAHARGVILAYTDLSGQRREAGDESLLAALRALGEDLKRPDQAPAALHDLKRRPRPMIEPVQILWNGRGRAPRLRAPGARGVLCRLTLEDGSTREWAQKLLSAVAPLVRLPARLPIGRHTLSVSANGTEATCTLLSAPARIQSHEPPSLALFAPAYALRSARHQGPGDLADLLRLAEWAGSAGCRYLGTLPMLAAYLGEPFDPSPYAPVSRLFWNELYLDVDKLGAAGQPAPRSAGAPPDHIDYRAAYRAKRALIDERAQRAFSGPSELQADLDRFIEHNPEAADYARFRACVERQRTTWQHWTEPARSGRIAEHEIDGRAFRSHLYAQFAMRRQLEQACTASTQGAAALYLDLPIGVHAGGYDTWRFRDQFALSASVGAPPDGLAPSGQNWGFPPLHPDASRSAGHAHFAAIIRNHLRFSCLLRLDHVMGLHRLYWIPKGVDARDGVYVRYPADELYAILMIEAHRAKARLVGENLGTVPPEVNRALRRRGVLGMYVAQFEFRSGERLDLKPIPPTALACVNTHDTPMWAAFHQNLGRTNAGAGADLRTVAMRLARSRAPITLVSLEDLWLEEQPQNVPGTSGDANWSRPMRRSLEDIECDGPLADDLRSLAAARPASKSRGKPRRRSTTRNAKKSRKRPARRAAGARR